MVCGTTLVVSAARHATADNSVILFTRGQYYSKDLRIRSGRARFVAFAAGVAEQEFAHGQHHVGEGAGADPAVGRDYPAAW